MNIAELRQEYMRAGLDEAHADPDPLRQFERWFEDALRAKLPLPNAMTLATAGADGAATARIVLLKGIDGGGFAPEAEEPLPRRRWQTGPSESDTGRVHRPGLRRRPPNRPP